MSNVSPAIDASWKEALNDEFAASYFASLKAFLVAERAKAQVFPPGPLIFSAFNNTPLPAVKVVIIGQDPYHGRGQANGLCFSVGRTVAKPPSLTNIFKELEADLGIPVPPHGDLGAWARQGVLLLNATLTVREGQAGSHQGKGWERFTDAVIRVVSQQREGLVFMLWGRYAQSKEALIDTTRNHLVLKAAHPSPLAGGAFFGCRHFSKANKHLESLGLTGIDWRTDVPVSA